MNKRQSRKAFDGHDPESAFLGYSKSQSDMRLDEIGFSRTEYDSLF
jgi:hypothetical protein